MAKSIQHIDFPEFLDLSSHCAENVVVGAHQSGTAIGKPCLESNGSLQRVPSYRLMSVIEHRGNAYSGHYLTYRRVSDIKSLEEKSYQEKNSDDKNWVVVSDDKVAFISWDHVQKCQAYMLMYEAI